MMVTINCQYEYGMRSVPDFCRIPEQAEACATWPLIARPGLRRPAFETSISASVCAAEMYHRPSGRMTTPSSSRAQDEVGPPLLVRGQGVAVVVRLAVLEVNGEHRAIAGADRRYACSDESLYSACREFLAKTPHARINGVLVATQLFDCRLSRRIG